MAENMAMMLHRCLCVITVIHVTSSQSTYDVIQQENDVSSCCGRTDQVLSQLVMAVSEIRTTVSQLQSDVAELKALNQQTVVAGMHKLKFILKSNISQQY